MYQNTYAKLIASERVKKFPELQEKRVFAIVFTKALHILSHMNLDHTFPSCSFKVRFNILLSTLRFFKWSHAQVWYQNFLCFFLKVFLPRCIFDTKIKINLQSVRNNIYTL